MISPSGNDELRITNVNVAFGEKTNGVASHGNPGAGIQISDDLGCDAGGRRNARDLVDCGHETELAVGEFGAQMLVESGFPGPSGRVGLKRRAGRTGADGERVRGRARRVALGKQLGHAARPDTWTG